MRLLVWASTYGNTIGGGPVLAPLLMKALVERGHDVLVVTDRRPADLPSEEIDGGVRILRFSFRQTAASDVALRLFSVRKAVCDLKRDFRPHQTYIFSSGYAELFHHETKEIEVSPLVTTLHDSFEESRFRPDAVVGRNLRASAWVCSCSASVQRNAHRYLPEIEQRSSVILNALPEPGGMARSPSFDPPVLLYVGRLVREKGVDVLIAALAKLRHRFADMQLVVVGDGEEGDSLKACAATLDVADRVSFVGSVPRDDLFGLYTEASVIIVPSRVEPFGLVALEAAHAARPVIASAVGGLPEVVVDNRTGLLVPPDSPGALAAAIKTLIEAPDRARALGEAARERALRDFRWDGFVDAYDGLFARLATQ